MPMGLKDGVLLSIEICSIGQWGKILVMVMGFVGTFEPSNYLKDLTLKTSGHTAVTTVVN